MIRLACPGCRAEMRPGVLRRQRLDQCVRCRGLWFDRGELAAIVQTSLDLPPATSPAVDGTRRCPRCDVGMFERRYAGTTAIRVEGCPRCHGVFLDANELTAIEGAVARVATVHPPEAMARATVRFDRRSALAAEHGIVVPPSQLPLTVQARFYARVHAVSTWLAIVATAAAAIGCTRGLGVVLCVPALAAGPVAFVLLIQSGGRHRLALGWATVGVGAGALAVSAAATHFVHPVVGPLIARGLALAAGGFAGLTLLTRALARPLDWPQGMCVVLGIVIPYAAWLQVTVGRVGVPAGGALMGAAGLVGWALAIGERLGCTHEVKEADAAALDAWVEMLKWIGIGLVLVAVALALPTPIRYRW